MKYWTIFFLIFLSVSCNKKITSCTSVKDKSIVINNHAIELNTHSKSIEVNEQKRLQQICGLLFDNPTYIKDSGVKHNSGFVEVRFKEDGRLYFYIIFTELNGTIVQFNDNYWKNDQLVQTIIKIISNIPDSSNTQ